ncbi:hypothetical protein [Kingella kingae]|nr:hypothetical protein [Kingella kingae]MDK4538203.1 hypothetical protein [Kingella kingae]
MITLLCAICTRRALSPCPIFISFHYNKKQPAQFKKSAGCFCG